MLSPVTDKHDSTFLKLKLLKPFSDTGRRPAPVLLILLSYLMNKDFNLFSKGFRIADVMIHHNGK